MSSGTIRRLIVGAVLLLATIIGARYCFREPEQPSKVAIVQGVPIIEVQGAELPPRKVPLEDCIRDAVDIAQKLDRKVNLYYAFADGTKLLLTVEPADTIASVAARTKINHPE